MEPPAPRSQPGSQAAPRRDTPCPRCSPHPGTGPAPAAAAEQHRSPSRLRGSGTLCPGAPSPAVSLLGEERPSPVRQLQLLPSEGPHLRG